MESPVVLKVSVFSACGQMRRLTINGLAGSRTSLARWYTSLSGEPPPCASKVDDEPARVGERCH